mmetsp:Transcript_23389/g.81144  ORF Transcript_23389/g.81144 Transcript_23389/m.81144 type:complete len:253 (-) Transcript_23389:532-1290(-)
MQAAPGMSAEGMAAIIAAAVQTAMAGLAAFQTGPAEPAASQADASGGVPIGATAPTLPPTEPVRPTTPPRRPRAEQQSRTPKSDASFLNYKTLVDKEYRVASESARASTTMVTFPDEAEKFIRACQMDPADVKDLSSSGRRTLATHATRSVATCSARALQASRSARASRAPASRTARRAPASATAGAGLPPPSAATRQISTIPSCWCPARLLHGRATPAPSTRRRARSSCSRRSTPCRAAWKSAFGSSGPMS